MSATAVDISKTNRLSTDDLKQIAAEYISKTKWATLATVREDGAPVLRAMGSFAPAGVNVYFSSRKGQAKGRHLKANSWVNFFFQHENQELASFKNVAIVGKAEDLPEDGAEYKKGVELLSARNPRFKERVERGELKDTAIYLIRTQEIKYLDYSNGIGNQAIQEVIL